MSSKFHHSIQRQGEISCVKLAGVIDEDNELAGLEERIEGETVVIDVGGVERINTCGVRDWVNWLGAIEARRARVVLVNCSPAIIAQINLVDNFAGSGVIKSFYLPYYCAECDREKAVLCETSELGPPPHDPPRHRCDDCDQVMEFDDMGSYFAFLAERRAPTVDLPALIDEMAEGSARLRTTSRGPTPLPSIPSLPAGSSVGPSAGLRTGIASAETEPGFKAPPPRATIATAANPRQARSRAPITIAAAVAVVIAVAAALYFLA
jgi:anti-anti-sigma regulatory factor